MTAAAGVGSALVVGGGPAVGDGWEKRVPTSATRRERTPAERARRSMHDPPAGRGTRRAAPSGPETRRRAGRDADPVALGLETGLVAACRRGDPGALERLAERFQAAVFGTALCLVGDRDAALEVTGATLFKLSRSLDRYDPARPLRPWVLQIATDESLHWLRARRREHQRLPGGAAGTAALENAAGGPDPGAAAQGAERRAAVRAALARLPLQYRRLLTLRVFGELSYQELAAQTGQDPNTVGVQLLRARRRLRDELRRGGYPAG